MSKKSKKQPIPTSWLKRHPGLTLLAAFTAACIAWMVHLYQTDRAEAARTLATIGEHSITGKDLRLRKRQQEAENAQAQFTDEIIFKQLAEDYVYAQILGRHGHPVTHEVLLKEYERIKRETMAPEKVKEFAALFPDENRFFELYILPVYVSREIYYTLFLRTQSFHQFQLDRIHAFQKEIESSPALRTSKTFRAQAIRASLQYRAFRILTQPDKPLRVQPLREDGSPNLKAEEKLHETGLTLFGGFKDLDIVLKLAALPVHGFSPLIEEENAFSILRLNRKEKGLFEFETVRTSKADYGPWLREEMQKTPVQCASGATLCEDWVKQMRAQ